MLNFIKRWLRYHFDIAELIDTETSVSGEVLVEYYASTLNNSAYGQLTPHGKMGVGFIANMQLANRTKLEYYQEAIKHGFFNDILTPKDVVYLLNLKPQA
ncbi:hypothetical protein My1_049 [Pectobacterium phage My1]|uniref:Uncharacterized protein n=1 Tax=Pectobacterium phage My1 TaxID=1204539 RepID=J9QM63_9CAUD|nr:hypothetical protein My1_049 [Pectobacterium phage My1]AFQ22208.1 hypothetical protein My1_049 [Pectobacterium phage My1]